MNPDLQHLRLLSIFHYVVGGLLGLFSCIPIIHLSIGIAMILTPGSFKGNSPPPAFLGWLFAFIGGGAVLLGWTVAICMMLSGRFLARRSHYLYCLVVAGLSCAFVPFGTVLGVLTIIVLVRRSVKRLFGLAVPEEERWEYGEITEEP